MSVSDGTKTAATAADVAAAEEEETMALAAPSARSRYADDFDEIERLGRGGFGSVWKCRNRLDGAVYAVKRIRFHFRRRGTLSRKLHREVQTIAQLDHPNVVRYHSSWVEHAEPASPASAASASSRTISAPPPSSSKKKPAEEELCSEDEYGEDDDDDDDEPPVYDEEDDEDGEDDEDDEEKEEDDFDVEQELEREMAQAQMSSKEPEPELQFQWDESLRELQPPLSPHSPALPTLDRRTRMHSNKSARCEWSTSTLFIQMHLYSDTLSRMLARRTEVNRRESGEIVRQIAEALRYIHSRGVIHRDLKPANVFLTPLVPSPDGQPRLAEPHGPGSPLGIYGGSTMPSYLVSVGDFGLATFVGAAKDVDSVQTKRPRQEPVPVPMPPTRTFGSPPSPCYIPTQPQMPSQSLQSPVWIQSRLLPQQRTIQQRTSDECDVVVAASVPRSNPSFMPTKHTSGIGTSLYASPEQIERGFYNEKTDIFSLGIITFELLTKPFSTQMERAIVLGDVRNGKFPTSFVETWPREAAFIRSCVEHDPAKRPSAMEILTMDLWVPELLSPITPSQQQQQVPQPTHSTSPVSPTGAWNQDTVCIPRSEVEQMRRRIAELEASVEALKLRLEHHQQQEHQQQQQQQWVAKPHPMVAVPPSRAARGDSTAVLRVSPLSLSLGNVQQQIELQQGPAAACV